MDRELFLNLKERFKPVMEEKAIHSVLVFGSQVSGKNSSRSDIDIYIVAPGTRNKEEILRKIWRTVEGDFDLWLFEELPLYLKIAVISEHIVLYCSQDIATLHEYFYFYRKLWQDQVCTHLKDL